MTGKGDERVTGWWWGGVGAVHGEIPAAQRGYDGDGGGNDGKKGRGMTGWGRDAAMVLCSARYPRQSAGMTEKGGGCGGERGRGMTGLGGGMRRWCCARRDTRGKARV